jgi:cardiolipin synthase
MNKPFNLCVGADAFMTNLEKDAKAARESLFVQAMTFEGDSAGERLMQMMIDSPAKDKRLIVDNFSRYVVSDHFVFEPKYLTDPAFRAEISNTQTLVRKGRRHGVQVKFVNPVGPLLMRYPLRNHKKMAVLDGEINYLGGINFSEHNFEWFDFMIRCNGPELTKHVQDDFLKTWTGFNQSAIKQAGESQLFLLNGAKSKAEHRKLFDLVRQAKKNVTIISPYLSNPLLKVLKYETNPAVAIEVITPANNNKGLFAELMKNVLSEGKITGWYYPGMLHMKCIMIDDEVLIYGSSNYDVVSYYFEQEIVVSTREKQIISDFSEQMIRPMIQKSQRFSPEKRYPAPWQATALEFFCKLASGTVLRPK